MKKIFIALLTVISLVFVTSCQTVQKEEPVEQICPSCKQLCTQRFCEFCGFDRVFGTTITKEEAIELRYNQPEVIAEAIKTVGDARLYVEANRVKIGGPNGKVYTPRYGKWIFSRTGYEELITNSACCCGGFANLACYLLADNYKEFGQIRWLGDGNHTINYVFLDGKYYPFDVHSSTEIVDYFYNGIDNLKEFGSRSVFLEYYSALLEYWNKKGNPSDIGLIFAHKTKEKKSYGAPWHGSMKNCSICIDEAYKSYTKVLYNNPSKQWQISYSTVDSSIPGYNRPLPEKVIEYPGDNMKEYRN